MRRAVLLTSLSAAAVLTSGLAALLPAAAADLERTSGSYGASSPDRPLTVVDPPAGEPVYVARYAPGERVALLLPVASTSRWPVRLVEVAPQDSLPPCGWRPDRVEVLDPVTGAARPFAPLTVRRDAPVQLRVSGAFGCPYDDIGFAGLTGVDRLVLRVQGPAGLDRRQDVLLGYSFGWTDDPEAVLTGLVTTVP